MDSSVRQGTSVFDSLAPCRTSSDHVPRGARRPRAFLFKTGPRIQTRNTANENLSLPKKTSGISLGDSVTHENFDSALALRAFQSCYRGGGQGALCTSHPRTTAFGKRTTPRVRCSLTQSTWNYSFRGIDCQTSGAESPAVRTSLYVLFFPSRPMANKSQPPRPISPAVHNCAARCNQEMRMNSYQHSAGALTLHAPVLPRLPDRIRRLVNAVYAAHGGADHMTLDEWRDVEETLKRKLVNKYHEHQQ